MCLAGVNVFLRRIRLLWALILRTMENHRRTKKKKRIPKRYMHFRPNRLRSKSDFVRFAVCRPLPRNSSIRFRFCLDVLFLVWPIRQRWYCLDLEQTNARSVIAAYFRGGARGFSVHVACDRWRNVFRRNRSIALLFVDGVRALWLFHLIWFFPKIEGKLCDWI